MFRFFQTTRKPAKKRKTRLGDRRRKLFYIRIGALATVILLTLTLVGWLARLDRWTIMTVHIEGNQVLQTKELERVAWKELVGSYSLVLPRSNSFVYPRQGVANALAAHSHYVDSVDITRNDLRTLTIRVQERVPHALWCELEEIVTATSSAPVAETCFYLDRTGFIYAPSPDYSDGVFIKFYGSVPEPVVGSQYVTQMLYADLHTFLDSLESLSLVPIGLTHEGEDYQVLLDDDSYLLFRQDQNLAAVLDNLESALTSEAFQNREEKLEYIDLRFGNKVFYKYEEEN